MFTVLQYNQPASQPRLNFVYGFRRPSLPRISPHSRALAACRMETFHVG